MIISYSLNFKIENVKKVDTEHGVFSDEKHFIRWPPLEQKVRRKPISINDLRNKAYLKNSRALKKNTIPVVSQSLETTAVIVENGFNSYNNLSEAKNY